MDAVVAAIRAPLDPITKAGVALGAVCFPFAAFLAPAAVVAYVDFRAALAAVQAMAKFGAGLEIGDAVMAKVAVLTPVFAGFFISMVFTGDGSDVRAIRARLRAFQAVDT